MAGSCSKEKRGKNARCHNHRCIDVMMMMMMNKIFRCLGMDLLCSLEFVIMEGKLSFHNIFFDIHEKC